MFSSPGDNCRKAWYETVVTIRESTTVLRHKDMTAVKLYLKYMSPILQEYSSDDCSLRVIHVIESVSEVSRNLWEEK